MLSPGADPMIACSSTTYEWHVLNGYGHVFIIQHELVILLAIFQVERAFNSVPFTMDKVHLYIDQTKGKGKTQEEINVEKARAKARKQAIAYAFIS